MLQQYNYSPNKVITLNIKELVLSRYYKYDCMLISKRITNTYYDKILR